MVTVELRRTLGLLQSERVDVDRDTVRERLALGAGPEVLDHVVERGLIGKRHRDRPLQLRDNPLGPIVRGFDRPRIALARDGHLQREQLGRRRVQRRPRRGERDPDARPGLAGLLDHGGEVLEPDRGVRGGGAAEPILRRPVRGADQIAEPHLARLRPGLLHEDHRITLDPTGAGRQLGELARGELDGLGVGLQLPAELRLALRLLAARRHHELAEREDGLAIEPPLLRQAGERRAGESLELLEILEVLFLDGDLLLESVDLALEILELFFLDPNFLPRIVLDGAGPEPGAEHAQAVGPFRKERAVDGLRRQRRDDQLDRPIPLGDAHFAGHQGLTSIDGHFGDPARRRPRSGHVFGRPGFILGWPGRRRFDGRVELAQAIAATSQREAVMLRPLLKSRSIGIGRSPRDWVRNQVLFRWTMRREGLFRILRQKRLVYKCRHAIARSFDDSETDGRSASRPDSVPARELDPLPSIGVPATPRGFARPCSPASRENPGDSCPFSLDSMGL